MWVPKIFCVRMIFCSKKNWLQKYFGSKEILGQKFLRCKKKFGSKNIFCRKTICVQKFVAKTNFGGWSKGILEFGFDPSFKLGTKLGSSGTKTESRSLGVA